MGTMWGWGRGATHDRHAHAHTHKGIGGSSKLHNMLLLSCKLLALSQRRPVGSIMVQKNHISLYEYKYGHPTSQIPQRSSILLMWHPRKFRTKWRSRQQSETALTSLQNVLLLLFTLCGMKVMHHITVHSFLLMNFNGLFLLFKHTTAFL